MDDNPFWTQRAIPKHVAEPCATLYCLFFLGAHRVIHPCALMRFARARVAQGHACDVIGRHQFCSLMFASCVPNPPHAHTLGAMSVRVALFSHLRVRMRLGMQLFEFAPGPPPPPRVDVPIVQTAPNGPNSLFPNGAQIGMPYVAPCSIGAGAAAVPAQIDIARNSAKCRRSRHRHFALGAKAANRGRMASSAYWHRERGDRSGQAS